MNRFIAFSCLLAVAAAEADPWYGVYGAYAHPALVSPHAIGASGQTVSVEAATAGHLATKPYLYGLHYGHYLGKREAESEPKADAEPWYGVYGAYAHPALVSPHAIGATGQTVSVEAAAAGHLATKALHYGYPYHYLGKREAEAEAKPWYGLYGYGLLHKPVITSVGALTTYSNGAVTPTNTPAVQQATAEHLAAKAGVYAAHGFPYYHALGKRSAEAEADPEAWYGLGYYGYAGLTHPVTSVGGLTTYANGAVVPYDPNGLAATSAHLASKGLYGLPYGAYGYLWG